MEHAPITNDWLIAHPECVWWKPPLFKGSLVFQTGVAQGINRAGRRDQHGWYVVSRIAGSVSLSQVHRDEAAARSECDLRHNGRAADRDWSRLGEWALEMLPRIPQKGPPGLPTCERTCIQVLMPGRFALAWFEHDVVQIMWGDQREFIADDAVGRITEHLSLMMRKLPGVVLRCLLDTSKRNAPMLWVQDALLIGDETTRTAFCRMPLHKRLAELHNITTAAWRDNVGACVDTLPFQVSENSRDLRAHMSLYRDALGYTNLLVRPADEF